MVLGAKLTNNSLHLNPRQFPDGSHYFLAIIISLNTESGAQFHVIFCFDSPGSVSLMLHSFNDSCITAVYRLSDFIHYSELEEDHIFGVL